MPHLGVGDRVKETTTTTGTGTIDLAGAPEGYQTFVAGIGNGHETYYSITNRDADEWEVGYGTITDAATDTLSRTTVISSSNGGSLVNFSAGTKDVICTLPADRSFVIDDEANVSVSANVTATAFDGSGAALTSLNASNVSSGTLDNARLDAQLQDVAGLTPTSGKIIQGDGANFVLSAYTIPTSDGTTGQVLTTNGSGAVTFQTPTVGDITAVTAGDGLTGGGTSGDVTLNVGAGTGVTVNANDIAIGQDVATSASPTFAGGTFTANVALGDSDYINLGAANDLQIVHNHVTGVSSVTDTQTGGTLNLQADNITLTGPVTATANVSLGDNDRLQFGASNDLQIYHNGSKSLIYDSGAGDLEIRATNFLVADSDGTSLIYAQDNAEVNLYHNGSNKFQTTSSGVNVTGSGNFGSTHNTLIGGLSGNSIDFSRNGISYIRATDASGALQFTTGGVSDRLSISSGGFVTINEGGSDIDFRVESNNNSNMLKVDGGSDAVFFGKSSSALATAGLEQYSNGFAQQTRDNGTVKTFNRTTSDGDIVQYKKDGITVGSINSTSVGVTGSIAIGTGDSGIMFAPSLDAVVPFNIGTNASRDNAIDLGYSTIRWKDLYLTGTVTNDGSGGMAIDTSGNVTFNDGSIDADFRVETNTNTHGLFVDAGGNSVVIGKTALDNTTEGYGFGIGSYATFVSDATQSLLLNRKTSDGDIAVFRKDNSTIGGIGVKVRTSQGRLFLGNSNTKLLFDTGVDAIIPVNNDGNDRDNAIDLGASSARFDDAHFGGTVNAQLGLFGTNTSGSVYTNTGVTVDDGTAVNRYGFTHFGATDTYLRMGVPNGSFAYFETNSAAGFSFNSGAVFNESSLDEDFRVESNGNTHMLFVDAGTDQVTIGTSGTFSDAKMHIDGALAIGDDGAVTTGETGYNNTLFIKGASAAGGDQGKGCAAIQLGDNFSGSSHQYAIVNGFSAYGSLNIVRSTGVNTNPLRTSSGVIDFTIRDNGNIGIGTTSPTEKLDVNGTVLADKAYIAEATLTDGATISWNMSTQSVAKVTLGGNRTLAAPTNGSTGQFCSLNVIQDGTGSRTLTWNAVFEFKDDTAPTLTTTGGKGDIFVFRYNGSKWLEVGRNLNISQS